LAVASVLLASDVASSGTTLRACTAAALASTITAWAAAAYVKKRICGYTGDCLGAVQQLSELSFLLAALAVLTSTLSTR